MARGEPTVCAKALRAPFFLAAVRTGRPIPELASAEGVSPATITDLAARVPHGLVVRIWDRFAELTGDPTFGLSAAEFVGAAPLDLVDHAILRAQTLRQVVARFQRYQSFFHDANDAAFVEADGALSIRQRFRGDLARSRHLVEFILAMWTMRVRTAAGPAFAPRAVTLRHAPPADRARHRALFGDRVSFEADHDALDLPVDLLDAPLSSGADGPPLEAKVVDHMLPSRTEEPFRARVERKVVEAIRAGDADIDAIARSVAASRRTLQRRLGEEGTTFRTVLDDARREVALELSARRGSTVTDMAFLLGFSDVSAFTRAFRRWTGKNPSEYLRSP